MSHCQPRRPSKSLPRVWLVSDARNDADLAEILAHLPRGSGFIYRHYHLPPAARRTRFRELQRIARCGGHVIILSDTAQMARKWGADGIYGPAKRLCQGPNMLRLITAHSLAEISRAQQFRANALCLSPVFSTKSHPGAKPLGGQKFRRLVSYANKPVIALGGMNPRRAQSLGSYGWAAIDGLQINRSKIASDS